MDIPIEALIDIFLNLPLNEIFKKCRLNKKANNLCNSNEFWRRYLHKNYYVDQFPENINLKELTIELQNNLEEIWKSNIYVSYRYPNIFINVGGMEDLFGDINYDNGTLATVNFNNARKNKIVKDIVGVNFNPNPNIQNLYQGEGEKEYTKALKLILKPTTYLTPRGPKIINFDVDVYEQILLAFYDVNEQVGEEFATNLSIIRDAIYLVNFK